MPVFKIPLTNAPQRFNITLAGRDLILVNRWNQSEEGGWFIDIFDGVTNEPLITNIPLVVGVDLLGQYEYVELGGSLTVYTDSDENAVPTYTNLGTESNLYFTTVEAAA